MIKCTCEHTTCSLPDFVHVSLLCRAFWAQNSFWRSTMPARTSLYHKALTGVAETSRRTPICSGLWCIPYPYVWSRKIVCLPTHRRMKEKQCPSRQDPWLCRILALQSHNLAYRHLSCSAIEIILFDLVFSLCTLTGQGRFIAKSGKIRGGVVSGFSFTK